MTKKRVTILSIVLNVVGIFVLLVIFVFPKQVEEPVENPTETPTEIPTETPTMTPTEIPTMTPTPTIPLKIKLDLEFDSPDDLRWLNVTMNGNLQNPNSTKALKEGYLRLGYDNPYNVVDAIYNLEPNQFIHFRTKSNENVCGFAGLVKDVPDQSKGIYVDGCTGNLFHINAFFNQGNSGDGVFESLPMSGSVPIFADVWADKIFWLNGSGDEVFYVITNSDDPIMVMFGSVALPEDWQYDRWGLRAGGYFDENQKPIPYYDIDLIRIGSGSLKDYLAAYVPAYEENQRDMDAFLEMPAQPMPELLTAEEHGYDLEDNENESD